MIHFSEREEFAMSGMRRLQEAWSSILFLLSIAAIPRSPLAGREHSCRSGNCTRQAVVEFLGAALRTAETSLLRPRIQRRHPRLPSFPSTVAAPAARYARLLYMSGGTGFV